MPPLPAADFVKGIEQRGLSLRLGGDRADKLILLGPNEKRTDKIRDYLRRQKPELLALLRGDGAAPIPTAPTGEPVVIAEIAPEWAELVREGANLDRDLRAAVEQEQAEYDQSVADSAGCDFDVEPDGVVLVAYQAAQAGQMPQEQARQLLECIDRMRRTRETAPTRAAFLCATRNDWRFVEQIAEWWATMCSTLGTEFRRP